MAALQNVDTGGETGLRAAFDALGDHGILAVPLTQEREHLRGFAVIALA